MAYRYADLRPWVLTDEGQRAVLLVRDKATILGRASGVFLGSRAAAVLSGDSWHQLAVIDRLVELGDLRRVFEGSDVYELAGRLASAS